MKSIANVAVGHGIKLTSENAKKFVSRLKNALKKENAELKTTQCYEILAKTFGSSNWHELIQHLEKTPENEINHTRKLHAIFDLHWIEFQYLVSDICKTLAFNTLSTDIVIALLEIIKDRQYTETSSYLDPLLLDKLLNDFNLSSFLGKQGYPLKHYHKVNATLGKEIEQKIDKIFMIMFDSDLRYTEEKIQINEIVKLMEMLKFIDKTNFIVKQHNHSFQINEVVEVSRFSGATSQYPLVSSIIDVSKNIDIKFLSLHDILISLFLKKNRIECSVENYNKSIIKPMFENPEFCAYLFNQLRNSVENKYIINENLHKKILTIELNFMVEFDDIMSNINEIYKDDNEFNMIVFKLNPVIDANEKDKVKIMNNFRQYIERKRKELNYSKNKIIVDIMSNFEVDMLK